MSENPWTREDVAVAQRELVDRQIDAWWSGRESVPHFSALVEAVQSTKCPGSLLEIGCASGYGREILDRAGVEYRSFTGIDINETAIRIAKERYPESKWIVGDEGAIGPFVTFGNPSRLEAPKFDTVIDGSCVLHVDDFRGHLQSLCALSRRFVILHRLPTTDEIKETYRTHTSAYGAEFPAWYFARTDVDSEMARHGFVPTGDFPADGPSRTLVYAKPRHYVSYSDRNYLGRLETLHASMVKHCGPFRWHVLDWSQGEVTRWALKQEGVTPVLWMDFLEGHPDLALDKLPGPPRTRIEHMWTVGPQFIADVMEETGEPVTYVDADILFHSSPEPVFAEIGGAPAGVVPHAFAPASAGLPGPTRETHEVFGKYNVGIVHFNDRQVAEGWAADCKAWCYDRLGAVGLRPGTEAVQSPAGSDWSAVAREMVGPMLNYGDQRFLDRWPAEYGAHVIQHPGAAPGPWCIHTRALDVRDGVIHFGGRPLVAWHYSSFRVADDGTWVASRPEYQITGRQELLLYAPYLNALDEAYR